MIFQVICYAVKKKNFVKEVTFQNIPRLLGTVLLLDTAALTGQEGRKTAVKAAAAGLG